MRQRLNPKNVDRYSRLSDTPSAMQSGYFTICWCGLDPHQVLHQSIENGLDLTAEADETNNCQVETVVIPEPSALLQGLAAIGAASIVVATRRRRAR
jgi:hypothetical protein